MYFLVDHRKDRVRVLEGTRNCYFQSFGIVKSFISKGLSTCPFNGLIGYWMAEVKYPSPSRPYLS